MDSQTPGATLPLQGQSLPSQTQIPGATPSIAGPFTPSAPPPPGATPSIAGPSAAQPPPSQSLASPAGPSAAQSFTPSLAGPSALQLQTVGLSDDPSAHPTPRYTQGQSVAVWWMTLRELYLTESTKQGDATSKCSTNVLSKKTIGSAIKYVEEKAKQGWMPTEDLGVPTGNNVFDYLIDILKRRGLPGIQKSHITDDLYGMAFNNTVDRAKIVEIMNEWTSGEMGQIQVNSNDVMTPVPKKETRNFFAFGADQLSKGVLESERRKNLPGYSRRIEQIPKNDLNYVKIKSDRHIDYIKQMCSNDGRMWNLFGSLEASDVQLSAEEYGVRTPQTQGNDQPIPKPNFEGRDGQKTAQWLKDIKHDGWSNAHFYKAKCGDCWICGKPINFFLVYTENQPTRETGNSLDRRWFLLNSACGEDEHILTPGLGNVLGTLQRSFHDHMEELDNPENEITLYGLRPSHPFCNQVKESLNLINFNQQDDGGHIKPNRENINKLFRLMGIVILNNNNKLELGLGEFENKRVSIYNQLKDKADQIIGGTRSTQKTKTPSLSQVSQGISKPTKAAQTKNKQTTNQTTKKEQKKAKAGITLSDKANNWWAANFGWSANLNRDLEIEHAPAIYQDKYFISGDYDAIEAKKGVEAWMGEGKTVTENYLQELCNNWNNATLPPTLAVEALQNAAAAPAPYAAAAAAAAAAATADAEAADAVVKSATDARDLAVNAAAAVVDGIAAVEAARMAGDADTVVNAAAKAEGVKAATAAAASADDAVKAAAAASAAVVSLQSKKLFTKQQERKIIQDAAAAAGYTPRTLFNIRALWNLSMDIVSHDPRNEEIWRKRHYTLVGRPVGSSGGGSSSRSRPSSNKTIPSKSRDDDRVSKSKNFIVSTKVNLKNIKAHLNFNDLGGATIGKDDEKEPQCYSMDPEPYSGVNQNLPSRSLGRSRLPTHSLRRSIKKPKVKKPEVDPYTEVLPGRQSMTRSQWNMGPSRGTRPKPTLFKNKRTGGEKTKKQKKTRKRKRSGKNNTKRHRKRNGKNNTKRQRKRSGKNNTKRFTKRRR